MTRGKKPSKPATSNILGKDMDDPRTWQTYTGQAVMAVSKELFDLAEKVLVVSAFSVLGTIATPEPSSWVPKILSVLLGLYAAFRVDELLAQLFWRIGAKGQIMFGVYVTMTFAAFFLATAAAGTFLTRLAEQVSTAVAS